MWLKVRNTFDILYRLLGSHFGQRGAKVVVYLVLLAFGIRNSEIKEKLGASYDTLRKYREALNNEDIDGLFVTNNADSRMKSGLLECGGQIMKDFDKNPPKTIREAQERIYTMTGVKRNFTRIRAYFKKKG